MNVVLCLSYVIVGPRIYGVVGLSEVFALVYGVEGYLGLILLGWVWALGH